MRNWLFLLLCLLVSCINNPLVRATIKNGTSEEIKITFAQCGNDEFSLTVAPKTISKERTVKRRPKDCDGEFMITINIKNIKIIEHCYVPSELDLIDMEIYEINNSFKFYCL